MSDSRSKNLIRAEQLLNEGKFDEALQIVLALEKRVPMALNDQLIYLLLKSALMNRLGSYENAINLANQAYQLSQELDKPLKQIEALLNLIEGLWRLGNHDDALAMIIEGEKTFKVIKERYPSKFVQIKASLMYHRGVVYRNTGDLDLALDYSQKSLKLQQENNLVRDSAYSLNIIGIIYFQKGQLNQALECYQKSLVLHKKLNNTQYIAKCLNNIGEVYRNKGELDRSLEYYQLGLAQFEKIGNKSDIAHALHNIGLIYQGKGDLNRAIEYYEQGLVLNEEIGNNTDISDSLFQLVSVAIDNNTLEMAQNYLQRLQQLKVSSENKIIRQRKQVAEALLLKTSDRMLQKANAQEIFQQVAEEEIVYHEVTVAALLNLCDLLLYELRISDELEVLDEVKGLVNRLLEIAKEQHSYWLLVETYVLKSKLALLELDIKSAQQLLDQAQLTAEEMGLQGLTLRLSHERDSFQNQTDRWELFIEDNAPMSKRLDLAQLNIQIRQMAQRRLEFTKKEILAYAKEAKDFVQRVEERKNKADN
ncbi:MAG: tetratricopeptide repeat protein [Promethearchaeota archaeon]